ncbi:MAG: FkbM family methyltransferase [Methylocystaceae bacterium]|nr:MAG: FkbM family methyltransferase [Methylocystaceae bacterium]
MKLPIRTLEFIARHPLASRRRIAAFYRYAWWQTRSRLQTEIEFDWIEGSKLIVKHGMTGATGNIYCGLHEFADMGFLLHLLQPGDVFIDVGANIGSYTILATAVCGSQAIAIEPDPNTMEALRRNIRANGKEGQVETVQAALGAAPGVVRFTVGHDTTNRISNRDDEPLQSVPMLTLDSLAASKQPQLIKMDVEGFEAEVVAGASVTLKNSSLLAIITENAEPRVRSAIEAAGFVEQVYDPYSRTLARPATTQARASNNFLFVRDIDEVHSRISAAPKRNIVGVVF